MDYKEFSILKGKTLSYIDDCGYQIIFKCSDGTIYRQYHSQSCCEDVTVEDICGDLSDLIGSPILEASEESFSNETPDGAKVPSYPDSYTWTFYKLSTIKGSVTIRWLGQSNGYYSERVYFCEVS